MGEKKQHFTARISESLVKKINDEAKSRNTTITAIVEEAFYKYFYGDVPGLCPSCQTQNEPDAKFCSQCGFSFDLSQSDPESLPIPKSLESYISKQREKQEKLEQKIEQMDEQMVKVLKMAQIISKYKEEHGEGAFESVPKPKRKIK